MKFIRAMLVFGVMLAMLTAAEAQAKRFSESDVPEALKPWISWVMADVERNPCPFLYSNANQKECIWPGALNLNALAQGAEFNQKITVYNTEPVFVRLPGDGTLWPQSVTVNGEAKAVGTVDGMPGLWLTAGEYTVTGTLKWDRMPEMLRLPQSVGLVNLSINGEQITVPEIDADYQWWIRRTPKAETSQHDAYDVKIFRKISDSIPQRVTTQLRLTVSGKPREEVISGWWFSDLIPMQVDSQLPARLEPNGALRVQLRPGTWTVSVEARFPRKVETITQETKLAEEEVWVFEAINQLRLVQVEGPATIDPMQTELPEEWKSLPAYYVKPGDSMNLVEKKRGYAETTRDQLSLNRQIWLDFSGDGYTVQDMMHGTIRQSNRLEAQAGNQLGRVTINGQNQFITQLEDKGAAGVEVRPGPISLESDSRITDSSLGATGWKADVDSLQGTLYLPLGWKLLGASGVDKVSSSWLTNWTLLDIFLVVFVVLAVYRLLGIRTAAIAAAGFILLHPEMPGLTGSSLFILGLIALLSVLPPGRFHLILGILRRSALVVLILVTLPFIIDHLRTAIYPQLDWANNGYGRMGYSSGSAGGAGDMATAMPAPAAPPVMMEGLEMEGKAVRKSRDMIAAQDAAVANVAPQQLYTYDPDSKVQTGPGIASWRENGIRLQWNGPVDQSQEMHFWLLSPGMNLFLALLRMVLLAAIIAMLFGVPIETNRMRELPRKLAKSFAILLAIGFFGLPQHANALTDYPPEPMLKELKDRMSAEWARKPDCLPECVSVTRSNLEAKGSQLVLMQEIHALAHVAVPLPGRLDSWRPHTVLVNGQPYSALKAGEDGFLAIELQPGVQQVQMIGGLPERGNVTLSFPLASHYTQATAEGWDVQGIRENGMTDGEIQLIRSGAVAEATTNTDTLEPSKLPPFLQVERNITLGLSWQVNTTVRRLTPAGEAVVVAIPLIKGEQIHSDLPVKNGEVTVNLGPQVYERSWSSTLKPVSSLTLSAPRDVAWVETWRVEVSTLWNASFKGTPNVQMQGDIMPVFQPWPGEGLQISVVRPKGAPGQTLTIDSSSLNVKLGERAYDASLNLSLRSSQGGQHVITLPEGAKLSQSFINGALTPLELKNRQVTIPVMPGSQNIALNWQQPEGIGLHFAMPEVNLGAGSVNATSTLTLPQNRWILFTGGPALGPAVLFWGLIPIMLLGAYILGRLQITPLRHWQWFLLFLGLSQSSLEINLAVIIWLLALGWRERQPVIAGNEWAFNIRQVVLGVLTLLAISCVFAGIKHGLLGSPDMKIAGNNSYNYVLNWYQDISGKILPQGWVISLPGLVYRGLMLAWALWMAVNMLRWLQWGWRAFSKGGYWVNDAPKEKVIIRSEEKK